MILMYIIDLITIHESMQVEIITFTILEPIINHTLKVPKNVPEYLPMILPWRN